MVSKSMIKLLQSLAKKKHRQKYHLFVAEGHKCVTSMLNHKAYALDRLYAISDWIDAQDIGVSPSRVEICTKEELKKLSSLKSSPPVLAVFRYEEPQIEHLKNHSSLIYLDDLQDPGNVGTIIRIADWFGVDAVVRSTDSADFFNPKVVQATMGSLGKVKVYTLDKTEVASALQGWTLVGAAMQSGEKAIAQEQKIGLVLGNEGSGLSDEVSKLLTHTLHIPGDEDRSAESLNVAISAGILAQHIWGGQI